MIFSLCSFGLHRWSNWSRVEGEETLVATLMQRNCMCCGVLRYRFIQKK